MSEVHIKDVDEASIDTILAEDIDFNGELSFKKPLMIKGRFQGNINASGDLYIGEKAEIKAKIKANVVSIKGNVQGNVMATSKVELFTSASLEGDILAQDVIMESGCRFNGICKMDPDLAEKAQ